MDPDQLAAYLDPHCLQEWFHTVFESVNCLSMERYKLICTIGQVKFSMDKYILAIYLSLDKSKILLFLHPCLMLKRSPLR